MSATYKLLVCPVCGEQMEAPDYEYGADSCSHDGVSAEPIEVAAQLDEAEFSSAAGLARWRLQDEIRETAFREAERSWFRKLDEAEVERVEAERRRYLSPLELALEDSLKSMAKDSLLAINRQAFRWSGSEISGGFTAIPAEEKA